MQIASVLLRLSSMETIRRTKMFGSRFLLSRLSTAPDADYIRLTSSYLEGDPRSLWTSVYEAYKAANDGAEHPNPWVFSRETMKNNYGLYDLEQALRYLEQSSAGSFQGHRWVHYWVSADPHGYCWSDHERVLKWRSRTTVVVFITTCASCAECLLLMPIGLLSKR